jgi:hypothetical protein
VTVPRRAALAAFALLVYAFVALGSSLARRVTKERRPKIRSGLSVDQISRLRATLPPVIGVLSEAPVTSHISLNPHFNWIQLELAPIVVVPARDSSRVLLWVKRRASVDPLAREHGLVVREDLGRGAFLLERPR